MHHRFTPALTAALSLSFFLALSGCLFSSGDSSHEDTDTTWSLPAAPGSVVAIAGDTEATVYWTEKAVFQDTVRYGSGAGEVPATHALSSYTAVSVEDPSKQCTVITADHCTEDCYIHAPPSHCKITGLKSDSIYTFVVYGHNGKHSEAADCRDTLGQAVGNGPLGKKFGYGCPSMPSESVRPSPAAADVPLPPERVTVEAGDSEVEVSWDLPEFDGGSPIEGYEVTAVQDTNIRCVTTETHCEVTGLEDGEEYTFIVRDYNRVGFGTASSVSPVAVPEDVTGPPGAPHAVAVVGDSGQATVSWSAPQYGGGGITGYAAAAVFGGIPSSTQKCATTGAKSCVITGLYPGSRVNFQVTAANAKGTGAKALSDTVTIPTSRRAPSNVVATNSGNAGLFGIQALVTVSWQSLSAGEGPYTARAVEDTARKCSSLYTSCVITGLTSGMPYTFVVTKASYTPGVVLFPSAPSSPVIPYSFPSAPTAITIAEGNGELQVSWSPPASDGGRPVLEYVVTLYASSYSLYLTCVASGTAARSCIVTGLAKDIVYSSVGVKAVNAGGPGASAQISASFSSRTTIPGRPTAVSGVAGDGQAGISWTPSANDGGVAVTSYTAFAVEDTLRKCTAVNAISCSITGLANGTLYTFKVRANNSLGASFPSNASEPLKPGPDPLGLSWTQRLGPSSNNLNAVAWGAVDTAGLFVAVGDNGVILTSSNGSSWTTRASGFLQSLRSAAWLAGLFVVVGDNGTILTSPNGITWTKRVLPALTLPFPTLYGVTGSGGRFVAVGGGGVIALSTDGINWTKATAPGITATLFAAAFSGTQWITVGSSAPLASPDGLFWNTRTGNTTQPLRAITWSGSQWVGVGGGTASAVSTSRDGSLWTSRLLQSTSASPLSGVVWTGSRFVYTGGRGLILLSSDGITEGTLFRYGSNDLNAIAKSPSMLVVVGKNGAILTSP